MEFNEFKKQCGYRSSQNDFNGEEVLNFCNHKGNPDNLEGNCKIENCKEIKMKSKEELLKAFDIWWREEGKLMTPANSDWEENKNVMKIAWLNGAYKMKE